MPTVSNSRRSAAAALAAGVLAAAPGLAQPGPTFGSETFMLDNGMQVVVIPNRRAPLVHHAVWYKVGAADEPPGKSGIAHMLEHLMFKGTEAVPDGEFSTIVARNGGNENAFTSQDYTGYFQNIAADRLELVMTLEADRMANLAFDEDDFATERDVVLEERRGRVDNRPGALLAEQATAAQFLAHPYGVPTIGWEHEIRAWEFGDAMAFYRAHYNARQRRARRRGRRHGGGRQRARGGDLRPGHAAPVAPRDRPSEPPQRAARRLEMSDPRVTDREWSRSWLAPSYGADPDGRGPAHDVLATTLGGGTTGRLYQALVVDRRIATGAGRWYSGTGRDYGRFAVSVSPRPEVAIARRGSGGGGGDRPPDRGRRDRRGTRTGENSASAPPRFTRGTAWAPWRASSARR